MNKILIALFSLGLLAGCATSDKGPAAPTESLQLDKEIYKIGVGDSLSVSVWKNPELSVTVPVRPDGMISVPLVGDVSAAGKEPAGLAHDITVKLENYVRNPQVTVVVTNASSSEFLHRVRVTGAVQNPSSVPYQKGMTIMDLVLVSGGLTEFADANSAKLYRVTPEGTKVYPVRLKDILDEGDIKTNYPVLPGDIVTIPEKMF
ncbi:MAG: sugar ABC transporter substrate-binding protein [Gammaproteobacteria bacterium]|nr:sugar ABC transporter substrate-binding protein [Gammaproteobacteria bacterium]